VLNESLLAVISGDYAILVPLDLSAAFDTSDHTILLERLSRNSWFMILILPLKTFSVEIGNFFFFYGTINLGCASGIDFGTTLVFVVFAPFRLLSSQIHCETESFSKEFRDRNSCFCFL